MTYRMTDEAMREAIARAHGLESLIGWPDAKFIPNYPADLNAIRGAVCALPDELQIAFDDAMQAFIALADCCIHELDASDWCIVFCRTVPCFCGCGLTIWKCGERKAKEGR